MLANRPPVDFRAAVNAADSVEDITAQLFAAELSNDASLEHLLDLFCKVQVGRKAFDLSPIAAQQVFSELSDAQASIIAARGHLAVVHKHLDTLAKKRGITITANGGKDDPPAPPFIEAVKLSAQTAA